MNNENMIAVVETLGETIQKLKDAVFVKDLIIEDLNNQLEACKKEIAECKAGKFEAGCEEC